MKNYKLYINVLSFFCINNLTAQNTSDNPLYDNKFEILRSQIDIFCSYISLTPLQKSLLSEADSLGAVGEYEIGSIYLEEIIQGLNREK